MLILLYQKTALRYTKRFVDKAAPLSPLFFYLRFQPLYVFL
jgi:hypothetical protein